MMAPWTGAIVVGVMKIRYFEDRSYIQVLFFTNWIWNVREESVMIPRFLACATGRMELPFTEMGKAVGGAKLEERSGV